MAHSPTRYLTPEERIILEVRRHYAVLIPESFLTVAVLAGSLALGTVLSPGDGSTGLDKLFGALSVLIVLRLGWKVWQWWEDRVFVTDQRIFEVSGVLTRKVASMPLMRVTDMTYQRSLLGRLLGYGGIIVESAGHEQSLKSIEGLPRPDDFYRTLTSLVIAKMPAIAPDDETIFSGGPSDPDDTGPLPRISI